MPSRTNHLWSIAALLSLLCATLSTATDETRQRLSLDAGWKFHLGDKWPGAQRLDKEGASTGPASDKLFSDVTWRTVNLPHDWAIELPLDERASQHWPKSACARTTSSSQSMTSRRRIPRRCCARFPPWRKRTL